MPFPAGMGNVGKIFTMDVGTMGVTGMNARQPLRAGVDGEGNGGRKLKSHRKGGCLIVPGGEGRPLQPGDGG